MSIFAIEINGLVAVLLHAVDDREARGRAKAELMTKYIYPKLEVFGRPLWDGKSKPEVRLATREEARFWHLQRVWMLDKDNVEYDDVDCSVFAYPVQLTEPLN